MSVLRVHVAGFLCAGLWAGSLTAAPSAAWAQSAALQFDAASIKPPAGGRPRFTGGLCQGTDRVFSITTMSGTSTGQSSIPPGTCRFGSTSQRDLIASAYDVPINEVERLIVGPGWISTALFDVEAKADRARPQAELQQMFRAMLSERFALRFHREPRATDGYAIVVAKGDHQMKMVEERAIGRLLTSGGATRETTLTATAISMERFAKFMQFRLSKPIVDRTGLGGVYDFTLSWTPGIEEMAALDRVFLAETMATLRNRDASAAGPSLFTALQEQLGLRLEPQQVPLDVIVVDEATLPTPN